MATVPDLIAELDDYGFEDVSPTRKVGYINATIWDVCSREPWPFLESEIDLNFNGSSPTPSNVPDDLTAVLKIVSPTTNQRVVPIRLDDLEENYATQVATVGTPQVYYFLGGVLKFTPIPSSGTGTYRMKYISHPDAVRSSSAESAIIIPPRHYELIVFGALSRLYAQHDDLEMSAFNTQRFEKKLADMRQDVWKQNYDGNDFVHQVEDYDFYYIS